MLLYAAKQPGRHVGPLLGHSSTITCIAMHKSRVYSGAMDCTVQVEYTAYQTTYVSIGGHSDTFT
jgi:hypothetical protein